MVDRARGAAHAHETYQERIDPAPPPAHARDAYGRARARLLRQSGPFPARACLALALARACMWRTRPAVAVHARMHAAAQNRAPQPAASAEAHGGSSSLRMWPVDRRVREKKSLLLFCHNYCADRSLSHVSLFNSSCYRVTLTQY